MKKVWNGTEDWAKHCKAYQKGYHGGEFTGGACKRLLSKKSQEYLSENVPLKCYAYIDAISTFEKVVQSCYGWKLSPTYKEDIAAFAAAHKKLKINETTKILNGKT